MADGRDVEKSALKSMPGRKGKNPGAQKPEWQIQSRYRPTNLSMRRHVGGQVRAYVYEGNEVCVECTANGRTGRT